MGLYRSALPLVASLLLLAGCSSTNRADGVLSPSGRDASTEEGQDPQGSSPIDNGRGGAGGSQSEGNGTRTNLPGRDPGNLLGDGTSGVGGGRVLDGTPFCAPTTCEDRGAVCGTISDGCGGVMVCGTCEGGRICHAASHTCTELTDLCENAGLECGATVDACGAPIACGTCGGGEVCNATTGTCGPCQPRTCEDVEGACGEIPDGCGATLTCDSCGDGEACDAIVKHCLPCEPTTCEEAAVECGTISDGCGATLDCDEELGGCGDGLACVSNRCRPESLPLECDLQMANCGEISHSCSGEAVDCGVCPQGEICQANRCEVCVPSTCDELELECGSGDDGCGGTLNCGNCPRIDEEGNRLVCHNHQCCTPQSCPEGACGEIADGCGGTLSCGSCPATESGQEQVCGLVTANVCTPCTRRTCDPGACGRVSGGDGCGGSLNCGSCPQDDVGEGERNVCNRSANVCEPCTLTKTTCDAGECGRIRDGCGGRIDCGGCVDGEVCGLVSANVCTPCTPTKTSCDDDDCGMISDGCAGYIDCGGCTGGKQCGLVTANVCSVCTPQACSSDKECGTTSNGCGGTADCGTCEDAGDVCIANQCCKPKTCNDPGVGCDATDDGCGGPLDCSCQTGLVCDASGGCCSPKTCMDVCMDGDYDGDDGCGNDLQCSDCSAPPQ
ncbi:MAG: hypothetical protein OXU20_35350 [Myxococcales bacterium]|nr:hypothetical protein [Myxococcales bacterium]